MEEQENMLEGVPTDIQPLFMKLNDEQISWTNPHVDTWYDPMEEINQDPKLHRITLKDTKNKIDIYFKSEYITDKFVEYLNLEEDEKPDSYHPDYVDVSLIASMMMYGFLSENYWPRPYIEEGVTNSKEYVKMREQYKDTPKFIDTEFGKKVCNLLSEDNTEVEFFQPLVGFASFNDMGEYTLNTAF